MSQSHYKDLIERIRHHCQQTAWDARRLEPKQHWRVEQTVDYDGWYIHPRNSFIALKSAPTLTRTLSIFFKGWEALTSMSRPP